MRLWTLHPRHLDPQGLVALWREALLAQAVLGGRTRGYTRHPQPAALCRTRRSAGRRGRLPDGGGGKRARLSLRCEQDRSPLGASRAIAATTGQIEHEWRHLGAKLAARNPDWHARWGAAGGKPATHPLFTVVPGPVQDWERP